MKDYDFDPEITLASALRVHGADLLELAGHVMADRARDGQVGSYAVERIGKAIAGLGAEFAKFQVAQKGEE